MLGPQRALRRHVSPSTLFSETAWPARLRTVQIHPTFVSGHREPCAGESLSTLFSSLHTNSVAHPLQSRALWEQSEFIPPLSAAEQSQESELEAYFDIFDIFPPLNIVVFSSELVKLSLVVTSERGGHSTHLIWAMLCLASGCPSRDVVSALSFAMN